MQSKKIAIFSKGTRNPLHPRIQLEIDLLKREGHAVQLYTPENKKVTPSARILKLISLSLFEWDIINEFKPFVTRFDVVIIYDSQLLPLSKSRRKKQTVLFETLDDNVELIVYHVFKKLAFLSFLKSICRQILKQREQHYLNRFVDKTIVNSQRLVEVFKNQNAVLNYYSSPFEGTVLNKTATNSSFLYLGKISLDKGLKTMLELAQKFEIKIHFFGDFEKTESTEIDALISACTYAKHEFKKAIPALKIRLQKLSEQYQLIGLSLIESVHVSYQFQDANKDIDYISLGIPFVGNNRPTTKKIINAGCGALIHEHIGIDNLISNKEKYLSASKKCITHYQKTFSQARFKNTLLDTLNH